MKRILIIAILATTITSLALAQTKDNKAAPSGKAEQEVVKVSDELIEALGRTDIAALDRLHTDDYIITQSSGLTGKAQLMEAWKSGRVKNTSASDVERSIRVYGDAAVVTGISTLKGKNLSGGFTTLARYTCVWVKQEGRWRLVAAQLSEVAGQPTNADHAAIVTQSRAHHGAFARKDVDGVLAVYSADVVMMPPNEPPIRGKQALRSWFAKLFSQNAFQPLSGASDGLELAGDMAVERLLLRDSTGQAVGKAIHMYRRQADGAWKITQDIWNTDVPATRR